MLYYLPNAHSMHPRLHVINKLVLQVSRAYALHVPVMKLGRLWRSAFTENSCGQEHLPSCKHPAKLSIHSRAWACVRGRWHARVGPTSAGAYWAQQRSSSLTGPQPPGKTAAQECQKRVRGGVGTTGSAH